MGLFEHFPYTNFHDMNTDWLVKVAKEFMDKYETLQDTIDTATTGITELAETLEAQLNAWYTTHSADIANQLANSLTAISNALNSATSAIATDRTNAEQAIASARANSITAIENKLIDAESDFDDHADEYGAEVIASLPPDYLNSLYGVHMVYPPHTKGVTGAMAYVNKIMVGKRYDGPPNPAIVDDATSNIIVFETGKGFVAGTMAIINKASSAFVSYPTGVVNLASIASTNYLIVNESGFHYLDLDFMTDGMPEYAYRKYEDVHATEFSTASEISAQPTSYGGTNKAFTPFRMTGTLNVTGAVFAGIYNPDTGAYERTVTTFPVTVEDKVVMVFSDTPDDVVIQVNDEGGGGGTEGAVLYSESQNLTTLEKTQAKVNIGANFDNAINDLQTDSLALQDRMDETELDVINLNSALNLQSEKIDDIENALNLGFQYIDKTLWESGYYYDWTSYSTQDAISKISAAENWNVIKITNIPAGTYHYNQFCTPPLSFVENTTNGDLTKLSELGITAGVAGNITIAYTFTLWLTINNSQYSKNLAMFANKNLPSAYIFGYFEPPYVNAQGQSIYIVNGGSIQEACNNAKANDIIFIRCGIYTEQVSIFGKKLHLIGEDKNNTFIIDHSGNYLTPPLEMNIGSLSNITLIEDGSSPTLQPSDQYYNLAYCLHADHSSSTGEEFIVENCVMINDVHAALGCGIYQNSKFTFRNCEFRCNATGQESKERGAFFFHTEAAENKTNQTMIVEKCIISSAGDKYSIFLGVPTSANNTGNATVRLSGCTIWNDNLGINDSIAFFDRSGGADVLSVVNSFGNTVSALNN